MPIHALALPAVPLVPLPLHDELARDGGLVWHHRLEVLHAPLVALWRAVCEARTPPPQDRQWFLSTFCERPGGEELEFLYAHSDIRPHLRCSLPSPAATLLLLLAPDTAPRVQRVAPSAVQTASGATHYLYTGRDGARVSGATLVAELRAAAAACRNLQRAAARVAEGVAVAESNAAHDAASAAAAAAAAAARGKGKGRGGGDARGGGAVLRRGTAGRANALARGKGKGKGRGAAGAAKPAEKAAQSQVEQMLKKAAGANAAIAEAAAKARAAMAQAQGAAAKARNDSSGAIVEWEAAVRLAEAEARQKQAQLQAHAEALLSGASEQRALVAAKHAELRGLTKAAGRLLTAQKGFDAGGDAVRKLARGPQLLRADLLRAETLLNELLASAAAASQQMKVATAEYEARRRELASAWAGRGAELRGRVASQRAAEEAAGDVGGVEFAVREAFRKYLKPPAETLGVRELRGALKEAGLECTSAEAIAMLKRFDASGDGQLDVGEFAELVAQLRKYQAQQQTETTQQQAAALLTPQVRAAFERFDTDGDGGLGRREVRQALKALGLPDVTIEDAGSVLKKYDGDGDGQLDATEFAKLVDDLTRHQRDEAARRDEALVDPQVRAAFEVVDTDRSGTISSRELTKALDKLGVAGGTSEAIGLVKKYDRDAKGTLRLSEFALMVGDLIEEQELRKPPPPEVLTAFAQFDRDRDGRLNKSEIRGALKQLGLPASEAEAAGVLQQQDADRVGGLDATEFHKLVLKIKAWQRRPPPPPPAAAAAAVAAAASGVPPPPPGGPAVPGKPVHHLTSAQLQAVLRARGYPVPASATHSQLAEMCKSRGVHEVAPSELAKLAQQLGGSTSATAASARPAPRPAPAAARTDEYKPLRPSAPK